MSGIGAAFALMQRDRQVQAETLQKVEEEAIV